MSIQPTTSSPVTPQAEAYLKHAKALVQGQRFGDAIRHLKPVLENNPDNSEALYMLAVCQRYQHRHDQALETLQKLQASAPDYARTYQEAGHNHRETGHPEAAIQAYQQAVTLNPALIASWRELARLHQDQDHTDASEEAREHYQRLSELPHELLSVTSMLHEGKLYKAERLCRAYLKQNPHQVEAMRLLANIGGKLHVLDDAEFLLESCLEFEPDNHRARFDYVNILHKRQKFAAALEQAGKLRAAHPDNPAYQTAYANESMAAGDFDTALTVYDEVLERFPNNHNVHLVRGHALKTIGRGDDAINAYQTAYRRKPNFGDAYWSLANLKTYRFSERELHQMTEQLQHPATGLVDRYHLCFALGKANEDRADYERSFHYYRQGNQLKQSELGYDPELTAAEFTRQRAVCTPALFEQQAGSGHTAADPIFVVGLPRAGSTLIEQILASHSQIDGTLELPNILALAHRLNGRRAQRHDPRYPGVLRELEADELAGFGRQFIEDTQLHRQGAAYFVDKMPNNFRHIGLIHLILPNARIIDARRHPLACCFSGYKQLFAEGQEFSYGLENIGRYYRGYVELMNHWDNVLPGKILQVNYEDVVADLETQVRRMLDYLELPFEPACVEFHKTERSVRTASSEQVRQPIYQTGVEQWRHFEPHLEPLKAALGEDLLNV